MGTFYLILFLVYFCTLFFVGPFLYYNWDGLTAAWKNRKVNKFKREEIQKRLREIEQEKRKRRGIA